MAVSPLHQDKNPRDDINNFIRNNLSHGSQITDMNKQASTMPDGDEKDAIKQQIVDLSQNALKYYDNCMSGDLKEPLLDTTYSNLPSDVSNG